MALREQTNMRRSKRKEFLRRGGLGIATIPRACSHADLKAADRNRLASDDVGFIHLHTTDAKDAKRALHMTHAVAANQSEMTQHAIGKRVTHKG